MLSRRHLANVRFIPKSIEMVRFCNLAVLIYLLESNHYMFRIVLFCMLPVRIYVWFY
jgi:hypothetical protein